MDGKEWEQFVKKVFQDRETMGVGCWCTGSDINGCPDDVTRNRGGEEQYSIKEMVPILDIGVWNLSVRGEGLCVLKHVQNVCMFQNLTSSTPSS